MAENPKPASPATVTPLTMNDLMAHEPISYSSGNGLTVIGCRCGQVFQRPWGYYKDPAVEQQEHRLDALNKIFADYAARIEREAIARCQRILEKDWYGMREEDVKKMLAKFAASVPAPAESEKQNG